MLKEDFTAVVAAWQPGGHVPTPVQLTSAALLGVGARIACGTQRRAELIRVEEVSAEAEAVSAANALALAKAAAPPPLPIVTAFGNSKQLRYLGNGQGCEDVNGDCTIV